MQEISVRPLTCSSCGAALPLGEGKIARCPYCKSETPIPEEYGAAQRAAKSFADDRKLAEQLYGRIGRPPGWFARAVGRGAEGATNIGTKVGVVLLGLVAEQPLIGIPLFMAAAYALGYPVAAVVRAVCWITLQPSPGPLSPYPILAGTTVLVVFGFGIPAVLFSKERALSEVRGDIHASLAAALPERPGGPSRCRNCGAALDVPPGALGVPCPYCKSDNLVSLPASWVAHVRGKEFHQFLRVDAALEAFRQASEASSERIWKLALGVVLVFPVVMFLAWLLDAAKIHF
jgi:predicted Zn-ribbon and HTH transcriptional regulator